MVFLVLLGVAPWMLLLLSLFPLLLFGVPLDLVAFLVEVVFLGGMVMACVLVVQLGCLGCVFVVSCTANVSSWWKLRLLNCELSGSTCLNCKKSKRVWEDGKARALCVKQKRHQDFMLRGFDSS